MLKKSITRPMCEYYNECKKNQQLFTKTICGYCNGCKKTSNFYNTYMWVLHIWNDLMEIIIERM
jgi:hypothetical protein